MSPSSDDSHELRELSTQVEAGRPGHLPPPLALLRPLQVASTFDPTLGGAPERPSAVPSPCTFLEAMGVDLLQERVALCQMEHWLRGVDTAFLFGQHVKPEAFTDDRLGRTLDLLFQAGLETLHSQLTAHLIGLGISVRRLHGDST